jgi:hypothetical protein
MKFPRRAFLALAVGAAALPVVTRMARAQACNEPTCRNAHILPWPRLMVWRITGAVT